MENELARMLWAQIWQVSLLILAVAVLSRLAGRNHPHFIHALWMVVLVKAVTPPIWSSPSGIFSWLQPARSTQEAVSEPVVPLAVPEAAPMVSPVLASDLLPEGWEPISRPNTLPENEAQTLAALMLDAEVAGPTDPVPPEPTPSADESPQPSVPAEWPLGGIVAIGVWLAGMLGALFVSLGRWISCWREIRRAGVVHDPLAQKLLGDLLLRLRVRRNVRLLISQSRIGPAVLGIFRPTVLIPARITAGKTPADLEPILAHELIHVRRGDLWVGWLQVLVQAAWWFHPLVWWAGRRLKHEAERCCDEEVIAELGLKPARYARALLDVLELKQILKPVPVLPGVKPVEITSKRLERIMRLRHGCRKRTPWWCWLIMLLTAALTLPGAAFVASAKDKPNRKAREKQKTESAETNLLQTRRFKVGDVLERYQTEFKVQNETLAPGTLAELLTNMVGELWHEEALLANGEAPTPSITIKGNTLRVRHTPRVLDQIAEELEILREHGFAQIVIEARIITAGPDVVEKTITNWEVLPSEAPERARPETKVENGVRSTTEKSIPMRMAVLDDLLAKKLIEACQSDARSNLMFCPKVTVFNGQHAIIQSTVKTPFVVGISSDGKPTVRTIDEGTKIQLRAVWKGDHIRLESQLTLSDIRNVDVVDLPGKAGEETSPKVQVPEVATTRINNTVKLPNGGSVLLGGLNLPDEERTPAGQGILQTLGLAEKPQKENRQLFISLRVVHLQNASEKLPAPPKRAANFTEEDLRKAQKAAELADLNYQKALEADRRLKGAVSHLELERLKLTAELAHLEVEQAKHEFERSKQRTGTLMLGPDAALSEQKGLDNRKESEAPTVLFFTATWCGPCQQMNPIVSRMKDQGYSVRNVDVDKERILAQDFNVRSIPTFLLIVDGKERHRIVGKTSEAQLRRMLAQIPADLPKAMPHKTLPYHGQGINSDAGLTVQIVPSAYYLEDDVQYFPQGPESKLPPAKVKQAIADMVKEFNTLFEQKRYAEAEVLAKKAKVLDPENPVTQVMFRKARFAWRDANRQQPTSEGFGCPVPIEETPRKGVEERIQEELDKKITLHFKNTPLTDVVKHIGTDAGINIVVDNLGLAEEGIQPDQAVTIDVEDVKLSSALKLVLEPLHLSFLIEDEVLKITSKTRVDHRMITVVTYPVADLIVPIPQKVTLDLREKSKDEKTDRATAAPAKPAREEFEGLIRPTPKPTNFDFDNLIQLMTTTIDPNSWSERGGIGEIRPYETTLSLVVRHSERAHEQIRDLLAQLRAVQDLQVSLAVQAIDGKQLEDNALAKKLEAGQPVVLTPEATAALKCSLKSNSAVKTWDAPKITLFNGQAVHLHLPSESKDGSGMDLAPVISADRRFVRLGLTFDSDASQDRQSNTQLTLKDGHSLLVEIGKSPGNHRKLILITPRIIAPEEEEELLSKKRMRVGTVVPNIIVQEEEEELLGIDVK